MGAKAVQTQSDGGSSSTTWGAISPRSEEMQIEALKEGLRELKEMYGEENIISAVIP